MNASEEKAIRLFSQACEWMKKHRPDEYNKTLAGRIGPPWSKIYPSAVDIINIEKLSLRSFCDKFDVIYDSEFFNILALTYFQKCSKDMFEKNQPLFIKLIKDSDTEILRPAVINYISKVSLEEMPEVMYNALFERVSNEKNDFSLGLSPSLLQKIRKQRFTSIIDELSRNNTEKNHLYLSLAGRVRNIKRMENNLYSIDFGGYIVLDSTQWNDLAYAYKPEIFTRLEEEWESDGYPINFWPGVEEKELVSARDIMLNIKLSKIILLNFNEFNALYTRDMLQRG